ncbi:MAG: alginate lyase family protein [Bacteroidales bacterium]|nr:alginate lyase family protein [Bacteroidales bacterium]
MKSSFLKPVLILISAQIILAGTDAMGIKEPAVHRDSIINEVVRLERERVITWADRMIKEKPVTITSFPAVRSAGGTNDFYSEGPYWWPDPENPDGPFIRKDGLRYPDMFKEHDNALSEFSWIVSILTSAYILTGEGKYAEAAVDHLKAWFIDPATMMNPSMTFSQAIKGICTGRGIGIIDAVPLIEVAQAVQYLGNSPFASDRDISQIKEWFASFLRWLTTHQYGIDEMNARNNHGSWWHAQAAAYAKLTGNSEVLQMCHNRLFEIIIPNQMAEDGSFPEELARTRPYGYSLFNMDALAVLAWILSDEAYDVWSKTLPDGRGITRGIGFIMPYVKDKSDWPYQRDITGWESQPERRTFILLASIAQQNEELFEVWKELTAKIDISVDTAAGSFRTPILWLGIKDPGAFLYEFEDK